MNTSATSIATPPMNIGCGGGWAEGGQELGLQGVYLQVESGSKMFDTINLLLTSGTQTFHFVPRLFRDCMNTVVILWTADLFN